MKYSRTVHSCPDTASSARHRMSHFPLQPRKLLDLLCHESTPLPCTRNFSSFSAKLLSSQLAPAYNWHERLCQLRCKTWHFAFIELHKVSFFSLLQPGNTFLNGSTILWCSSHSPEFFISCKLAECSSVSHHWDQEQRCSTIQDTTATLHVYC